MPARAATQAAEKNVGELHGAYHRRRRSAMSGKLRDITSGDLTLGG